MSGPGPAGDREAPDGSGRGRAQWAQWARARTSTLSCRAAAASAAAVRREPRLSRECCVVRPSPWPHGHAHAMLLGGMRDGIAAATMVRMMVRLRSRSRSRSSRKVLTQLHT